MFNHLQVVPLVSTLKNYQIAWLRGDVIAGITACIIMIPSVLAYAELVHMPPVSGIHAALAASLGYALFASSRHVIAGPDAAIGLLAGTAILPLAAGDPSRIPALAATLALLSGVVLVFSAHLRIGTIADFLSRPVLVGYLNGASLILVSTQLGKLFAIRTVGENFFPLLWQIMSHLGETHLPTLGVGIVLISIMVLISHMMPRLPGALVVSILAILGTQFLGLAEVGVALVGPVPSGTPEFMLPVFNWSDIPALAPAAVAIAFLAFSDGILLAQVFADKNKYSVNSNLELNALGMANIGAGILQGFPVSASQSRTAIVDAAGGKSQVAQLVAAGGLILFLLFLTDLLAMLPKVALGSILIVTGMGMLEIASLRELYRIDRFEFSVSVMVTAAILIAGVVPGIILGLLISLVGLIVEVSRPGDAVLQRPGPGRKFRDYGPNSLTTESVAGLLIYRLYAPLIFANARFVVNRLRKLVESTSPPVKWLVIDAQAITDMDVTAAQRFAELFRELREARIEVKIADASHPLMRQLERVGLSEILGEQHFYKTVQKVVEAYEAMQRPIQKIELLVQQEDEEPFTMVFSREGSNMTVLCSCHPEGDEAPCDHLLAVLRGDFSELNILNGGERQIKNVLLMMEGSDVGGALSQLATAEDLMQSAQREYQRAKIHALKAITD